MKEQDEFDNETAKIQNELDNKIEKAYPTITEEIRKVKGFISALRERSEEITDTNLDLSCKDPYTQHNAKEIIEQLFPKIELKTPDLKESEEKYSTKLEEELRKVTQAYRQMLLNTLVGIGNYYTNSSLWISTIADKRNTPQELIDDWLCKEVNIIVDPQFFVRSYLDNLLADLLVEINDAWAPMYMVNNHKMLAKKYLKGEIDEKYLNKVFAEMNEATIVFKDEGEEHVEFLLDLYDKE